MKDYIIRRWILLVFVYCGYIIAIPPIASAQEKKAANKPLEGTVWIQEEGYRGAWCGHGVSDQSLDQLVEANCNTLMLVHFMSDFLDLESASRKGEEIVIDYDREFVQKLLTTTDKAAARGLHVIWVSAYKQGDMLPTLERLGYESAFVEGPTRYLAPGPNPDPAALDQTFWRGITGAHGEIIARLSLEHPIAGLIYDTEHYDGGIMYMHSLGFSNLSFGLYLEDRDLSVTVMDVPAGTRYEFLKNRGLLDDYYLFLEEGAYTQCRYLAERWHAINPSLVLGIWELGDNWFSRGFLRGFGGAVPSLGLSPNEYYRGSNSTQSLAEFIEAKVPNMLYIPGFFPSQGYSAETLQHHIAQSIRVTKRYWLLAPTGILRDEAYRRALSTAYQSETAMSENTNASIDLRYRVEQNTDGKFLVVETVQEVKSFREAPLLTLRDVLGGAPLCTDLPMEPGKSGLYQARIPLIRLLSNNLYQPDGFRSGVVYNYDPVPNEYMYADPYHTRLFDGRDCDFFGAITAWTNDVANAEVSFDLHRPYKITKVAISQPAELEDRLGGPSEFTLYSGRTLDEWERYSSVHPFWSDDAELSEKRKQQNIDKEWLAYVEDNVNLSMRWLKIRMEKRPADGEKAVLSDKLHARESISLGEVAIWGEYNGEVQASLTEMDKPLLIGKGKRFSVRIE